MEGLGTKIYPEKTITVSFHEREFIVLGMLTAKACLDFTKEYRRLLPSCKILPIHAEYPESHVPLDAVVRLARDG